MSSALKGPQGFHGAEQPEVFCVDIFQTDWSGGRQYRSARFLTKNSDYAWIKELIETLPHGSYSDNTGLHPISECPFAESEGLDFREVPT